MAKGNTSSRTRNYATIVYPESAPKDWVNILKGENIPAFVSPLHDKDVTEEGKVKKPHYHVMLMYDSVKTPEQATQVFDKIGGVGCEIIQSIRAYARYLCHLDDDEKEKYPIECVREIGGTDYEGTIGLATDRYKAIKEMIRYCNEKQISSYHVLFMYAMEERNDWFRVLCDSGTYVLKEYLKSKTWAEGKS